MTTEQTCPVCHAEQTFTFLRRQSVPVLQNVLLTTQEAACRLNRGNLDLRCCKSCGFVCNAAFDPNGVEYDAHYENTQTCSAHFREHLEQLAQRIVVGHGLSGGRFVEVGCGKGHFLKRLVEIAGPEATGFGFDPTYLGPDELLRGRVRFVRRFFDSSAKAAAADVVVCRHVIEHIADPLTLLRSIRAAVECSPAVRIFFETPCVEWILRNRVVWDFFYEHCSYFSRASLTTAFEGAGFRVCQVRHVFGGQYLWLEAELADTQNATRAAGAVPDLASGFGAAETGMVRAWLAQVRALAASGGVVLWGAGAKGVTFANLIDPERQLIRCLVDVNPSKQGKYVPGTAHPILAPSQLIEAGVVTALVLNPNYLPEVQQLLREQGIPVRALVLDEPGIEVARRAG